MKYLKKLITKHINIDEEEWNELTSKFEKVTVITPPIKYTKI